MIWQGSIIKGKGYGEFAVGRINGKPHNMPAHRFAYEIAIGPIPQGLAVYQTCLNRACVNPDHLIARVPDRQGHKLLSFNPTDRSCVCATCGPTRAVKAGKGRNGEPHRWRCVTACGRSFKQYKVVVKQLAKQRQAHITYRKFKQSICARCGFVPTVPCQLDVHHKDGNHSNNSENNLETICANCHRLHHWLTVTGN